MIPARQMPATCGCDGKGRDRQSEPVCLWSVGDEETFYVWSCSSFARPSTKSSMTSLVCDVGIIASSKTSGLAGSAFTTFRVGSSIPLVLLLVPVVTPVASSPTSSGGSQPGATLRSCSFLLRAFSCSLLLRKARRFACWSRSDVIRSECETCGGAGDKTWSSRLYG